MKKIVVGIVLMVLGMVLFAGGLVYFVLNLGADNQQFLAPGEYTFTVGGEEEQDVSLWHDHKTMFRDKFYSNTNLGGFDLTLRNEAGEKFSFNGTAADVTMSNGGTSRREVAEAKLKPGRYTVSISGIKQPAVFSISTGHGMLVTFIVFFTALFGFIVIDTAGLIVLIIGIVQHAKKKKLEAQTPSA